jgi:DNA topoisomerase-1
VDVKGHTIRFTFKGKKGVQHEISLRSKRLSRIITSCMEIPGKELFQYFDENGNRQPVESGMLNDYIHQLSGSEFSSKDFRTWSGTLYALAACIQKGDFEDEKQLKHKTVEVFDEVSRQLGNTRTVCKKYYVHPGIIKLYEDQNLEKYLKELDNIEKPDDLSGLTSEERVLMKILQELV